MLIVQAEQSPSEFRGEPGFLGCSSWMCHPAGGAYKGSSLAKMQRTDKPFSLFHCPLMT